MSRARSARRAAYGMLVTATIVGAGVLGGGSAAGGAPSVTTPSPAQARASQWYLSTLGVTAAQRVTRGEGVTVCLIDSGVDLTHPDLVGVVTAPGRDFSGEGRADGLAPVAGDAHGTEMAGLVVGQGQGPGHALGTLGVAPGATLISMSDRGIGARPGSADEAIRACVDRGATVISMSFAGGVTSDAVRYAQGEDVVLVAAGPNDPIYDKGNSVPASFFGVLAVSGVDASLRIDPNSGASGFYTEFPESDTLAHHSQGTAIMGPYSVKGVLDASTGIGVPVPGGTYRAETGNSLSTAVVAGAAALVRAAHPELNAANVINRLLRTARPPTDGSAVPSKRYGFGVLDASAAVNATVPSVANNPLGSLHTGSGGVWLPRIAPQRAESASRGATSPTTPASSAPVTPSATASAAPPSSRSSGMPRSLLSVGAFLLLGAVAGGIVAGRARSRARAATTRHTQ